MAQGTSCRRASSQRRFGRVNPTGAVAKAESYVALSSRGPNSGVAVSLPQTTGVAMSSTNNQISPTYTSDESYTLLRGVT